MLLSPHRILLLLWLDKFQLPQQAAVKSAFSQIEKCDNNFQYKTLSSSVFSLFRNHAVKIIWKMFSVVESLRHIPRAHYSSYIIRRQYCQIRLQSVRHSHRGNLAEKKRIQIKSSHVTSLHYSRRVIIYNGNFYLLFSAQMY